MERKEKDETELKPVPEIGAIEKVITILDSEGIKESAETIADATGVCAVDALINLVRGKLRE